jgi:hypothetical protein
MHCNVPFKHPDGLRWLYRDWLPIDWLARTAIKKQLPALHPPALKEGFTLSLSKPATLHPGQTIL